MLAEVTKSARGEAQLAIDMQDESAIESAHLVGMSRLVGIQSRKVQSSGRGPIAGIRAGLKRHAQFQAPGEGPNVGPRASDACNSKR